MLRRIKQLWTKQYWSKSKTALETLDALTATTWSLSPHHLSLWINSDQKTSLQFEFSQTWRVTLLQLWFGFNVLRLAWCSVSYHWYEPVPGKLRLPYYFGDAYQLLMEHSFYSSVPACLTNMFVLFTVHHLHKARNNPRLVSWCRVLIHIDVILRDDYRKAKTLLHLLSRVPRTILTRYRDKFRKALSFRTLCLKGNNFFLLGLFAFILYQVECHPEWNHPFLATILVDLVCQFFIYFWFRVVVNIHVLFYLNWTFVIMLLDSINQSLASKRKIRRRTLRHAIDLFDQTLHVLADVNRFFRQPLLHLYILHVPGIMIAFYLVVFVPTKPIFSAIVTYTDAVLFYALHFNNLTAARMRNKAIRLYKTLYLQRIIMSDRFSLKDKLKMANINQIIICKSRRFGVQIGPIGIATQRVTILCLVAMIRTFIFLIIASRRS